MNTICIPQNKAGLGGVGGGAGHRGQSSQIAEGAAARSYGVPVITTTTGMKAQFTIRLTKDLQGTIPSDLQNMSSIHFICIDSQKPGNILFDISCSNDGNGIISFQLLPQHVDYHQGLHHAQVICRDAQQIPVKIFNCLVEIRKGLIGSDPNSNTPLTIADVRSAAYDTCAQLNYLLDDLQFSDMQIAQAMQNAVKDWNEKPPQLYNTMTVTTFPYTSKLKIGALGHLFRKASYRYFRNAMRHSNAGLVFDDQDKGQIYAQLGASNLGQWNTWVDTKKTQLNMLQTMGTYSDAHMQGTYNPWWY